MPSASDQERQRHAGRITSARSDEEAGPSGQSCTATSARNVANSSFDRRTTTYHHRPRRARARARERKIRPEDLDVVRPDVGGRSVVGAPRSLALLARGSEDQRCCCDRRALLHRHLCRLELKHRPPSEPASRWRWWPLAIQRLEPRVWAHLPASVEHRAVRQRGLRRQWVDELRVERQVAAQHQDGSRVVGCPAVVGGREDSDQLAGSEALKAWWNA